MEGQEAPGSGLLQIVGSFPQLCCDLRLFSVLSRPPLHFLVVDVVPVSSWSCHPKTPYLPVGHSVFHTAVMYSVMHCVECLPKLDNVVCFFLQEQDDNVMASKTNPYLNTVLGLYVDQLGLISLSQMEALFSEQNYKQFFGLCGG